MEALNLEVVIFLLGILAFGSSLFHYSAYARAKAKVVVDKNFKKY